MFKLNFFKRDQLKHLQLPKHIIILRAFLCLFNMSESINLPSKDCLDLATILGSVGQIEKLVSPKIQNL